MHHDGVRRAAALGAVGVVVASVAGPGLARAQPRPDRGTPPTTSQPRPERGVRSVAAQPRPDHPTQDAAAEPRLDRAAAVAYATGRAGTVSLAAVDARGRFVGHRSTRAVPAASVLKVMLMAAWLRRESVRGRPLRQADRRLLSPMMRRSDNATATRILDTVGPGEVARLARAAGMRRFRLRRPWGRSQVTAGEQARFMRRLDRLLPRRHRAYARLLLRTVTPAQRWGVAKTRPPGWRLFFKGGWGSGTGRVCHQVAALERGGRRVGVAALIEGSPSHAYGTETLRGIFARLLRPLGARPPG